MDWNQVFANTEALQWAATVAAGLVIAAVTAVIFFTGIKLTGKQWQQAKFYWSKAYPLALAQLDQDTDWFPTLMDGLLDQFRKANWQPVVRRFVLALVEAANSALAESPAKMPDGMRVETALGVGAGIGDAADQQAVG